MPRALAISLPPAKADALLERVQDLEGVASISLQRGAALRPPGDVVSLVATVDASRAIIRILSKEGYLEGASLTTSEPRSIFAPHQRDALEWEEQEPSWEEMGSLLRRETNPRMNFFLLMAFSGAIAAAGLWTDTIHLVVGAMVITPGFEPILRVAFGWTVGPSREIKQGARGTLLGYLVLAAFAAATFWVLALVDPASGLDLGTRYWVQYWSSITPSAVFVSSFAALAGAAAVVADRPVLTAGAMIALALVPGMALFGMGLAAGSFALAGMALLRWGVDVVAVAMLGAVLLLLKRRFVHHRRAVQ